MTPTPEVQERLRRYLLGQVAEDAREEIEKDLLTSDELFEELLMVEDEITDAYLRGELNGPERSNFEQHFLATPERHEKLTFARALHRHVIASANNQKSSASRLQSFIPRRSFFVRGFWVVVLISVVAGGVWLYQYKRTPPRTFATLSLTVSHGTRAEGPDIAKIKLPIREDALELILRLPDQTTMAPRFRAELENQAGGKRNFEIKMKDNRSVSIIIPASELQHDEYSIKLFAVGEDGREQRVPGTYLFTIE